LGSGLPVARSEQLLDILRLRSAVAEEQVHPELLQAQVEVSTPVCESLDQVRSSLAGLRSAVSTAAAQVGCGVAASGAAPVRGQVPIPVTAQARYLAISADAPRLVDEQLINGMHVHVAVPDRDSGVAVLNRIRPWLPVLVAMGANSPLWDGHDTGFASWRTVVFGRWPVSGAPPAFADAADYGRRTQALLDTDAIRDRGQVHWQARLSERFPTVEVRALDVQLRVEDAVLFTGLIRALVVRALELERSGAPAADGHPELIAAANWKAARHGLDADLADPGSPPGRPNRHRPAAEVVGALLDELGPSLEQSGDYQEVAAGVHRLLRDGTGATRQRRAFADGGLDALIDELLLVPGPVSTLGRI
jgi:carboxylate-amine ligase